MGLCHICNEGIELRFSNTGFISLSTNTECLCNCHFRIDLFCPDSSEVSMYSSDLEGYEVMNNISRGIEES